MGSETSSYLIIGAGVFGTSTAYHLIQRYPDATVTLVDRDAFDASRRVAASWDWNKVVRADYADLGYCKLALEAQDVWRADPLWKPFYHESGIYWISRTGFSQKVLDNYAKLGRQADLYSLPVEEARKLHGGIFGDADYTGVKEVLINNTSGWADARDALRKVIETSVEMGVKYVVAEVTCLEIDDVGVCRGVRTAGGVVLTATHTILCSGSFTPKLLEMSAEISGIEKLRADERIISAGVTTGLTHLNDGDMDSYSAMPVCIQENPPERGASNGMLPPNKDSQIKWWGQYIFKNTQEVKRGKFISAPPDKPDYAEWEVPDSLKNDIRFASKVTAGKKGESWELEQHRICWEALTPSEDFIISKHSAADQLFVATCGSFHGWKFFPILGRYVLQMLNGELPPEWQIRWAWDRQLPDPSDLVVWPKRELKDLK
ncbi:hypothetical protein PFICI_08753 [Pestalotiopsis fici W106-1]|uniref:FAD dependent oxidoreductase domain-containing protein n=1 Tax=Pestalotiopsis fici (strain W106-1 / CGMCC3.15140) TaxID=1229662 RepID=W3WYH7_PESFW|nr:uncharacterized protein PFICI_08753 [Pestalotiopsis fici W106-1]ETS78900.1 hypothetical protein PFICI_08753 [Pestalotiopsis fici W106-1]